MADRTSSRFIRTPRYELWRRIRWCTWLVFVWNALRVWEVRGEGLLAAMAAAESSLPATLATLAIFALEVFMFGAPLFIILWSACTFMMSRSRREATFSPTQNLEYYREKLKGVSAAQVSMLADLRMEPREDAAATLLSLAIDRVISLDGGVVFVRDADALAKRPASDRLLVELASTDALGAAGLHEWTSAAEQEAVDGTLLQRVSQEGIGLLPHALRGCGLGCLIVIASALLFTMLGLDSLFDVLDIIEDDYELVPHIVENPLLLAELLVLVVLTIVFLVAVLLPIIDVILGLVENGDASRRYRRTQLGEQVAECVYGIRNYLRDFTSLSSADRNVLMLWDEFAVYALALGGNSEAVDEILASKGFDRSMLGL